MALNNEHNFPAELGEKLRGPDVRRLVEDELRRGNGGTEIYQLNADDDNPPMYFNISAMRQWAENHCEIFAMPINFEIAEKLLSSGAIDEDRIRTHTIKQMPKPLIVCRELRGGDHIVDGAHTFMTFCIVAAQFNLRPPVPAYLLQPTQWRKFVIPQHVAAALEISSHT